MNTIKAFFKEKGLYLFCLALIFAATAVGILALRSVVNNLVEQNSGNALQEDSTWNQPNAIVNDPVTDLPQPTATPAPTSAPSAQPSAAPSPSQAPSAPTAAPSGSGGSADVSAPSAVSPLQGGEVSLPFSGEELVYNKTLDHWRTHNGADYTAPAGTAVRAVRGGTVTAITADALWGATLELADEAGRSWKYCGLADITVAVGDTVPTGTALGQMGAIPTEAAAGPHLHLECSQNGILLDPESQR